MSTEWARTRPSAGGMVCRIVGRPVSAVASVLVLMVGGIGWSCGHHSNARCRQRPMRDKPSSANTKRMVLRPPPVKHQLRIPATGLKNCLPQTKRLWVIMRTSPREKEQGPTLSPSARKADRKPPTTGNQPTLVPNTDRREQNRQERTLTDTDAAEHHDAEKRSKPTTPKEHQCRSPASQCQEDAPKAVALTTVAVRAASRVVSTDRTVNHHSHAAAV